VLPRAKNPRSGGHRSSEGACDAKALIDEHFSKLRLGAPKDYAEQFTAIAQQAFGHLVLVDDSTEILRAFIPPLVVATGGDATFIHCVGGTVSEVAHEVLDAEPSVALIDGALGPKLPGWEVAKEILKVNPEILCIGFSAEPAYEQRFNACGAGGFVYKRLGEVQASLHAVFSQVKTWQA
jgi:hypothetical protein